MVASRRISSIDCVFAKFAGFQGLAIVLYGVEAVAFNVETFLTQGCARRFQGFSLIGRSIQWQQLGRR